MNADSLDLAELRRIAEEAQDDWDSDVPTLKLREFHEATDPAATLALLDRIESLEAERDELRAWQALTIERVRDTTDLSHSVLLEYEDIPGRDFGELIDKLKRQRDRAEARLARVTDDSTVEVAAKAAYEGAFLKHAPDDVDRWDDLVADNHPAVESWREVARAVIRAVAADEQEAGR